MITLTKNNNLVKSGIEGKLNYKHFKMKQMSMP